MKENELVAAAVAALLCGAIPVESFAFSPERSLREHFGAQAPQIGPALIDRIGSEYEVLIASSGAAQGNRPERAPGAVRGPAGPNRTDPKGPGRTLDPTSPPQKGWYGCITCT